MRDSSNVVNDVNDLLSLILILRFYIFCEECNGDDNNGSLNKGYRKKATSATRDDITVLGEFNFNFTNMFEKRRCSKEGGDHTQTDADANHDHESVAVGVSTETGA